MVVDLGEEAGVRLLRRLLGGLFGGGAGHEMCTDEVRGGRVERRKIAAEP